MYGFGGGFLVTIFTTPSCSSCRKAKKWLKEHNISYSEKNLFNIKITDNDIKSILEKTENGFEDIISTRSKIIKEQDINIDDMKIKELVDFIKVHPNILRRPIILDDKRLQIGYNDEEIRCFLPRDYRRKFILEGIGCVSPDCDDCIDCNYVKGFKKAINT